MSILVRVVETRRNKVDWQRTADQKSERAKNELEHQEQFHFITHQRTLFFNTKQVTSVEMHRMEKIDIIKFMIMKQYKEQ